jgi:hypothetical protein
MSSTNKTKSIKQSRAANGALSQSPEHKHADWQKLARSQGVEPIGDYQKFLTEVGSTWPKEESLDDFLGWLDEERMKGVEDR